MERARVIKYPYLLIVIAGLLVYARTVSFGFTYLDDQKLILENSKFLSDLSNAASAFRQDVLDGPGGKGIYYRPVLTLSFMLDARLRGDSPVVYHLTNLILHLAASCLVFVFLKRLRYDDGIAAFFSLIFVVHPALTQGVAWIPGRNDILLTIFVLSSFICFLGFLEGKGLKCYMGHIFFLVLALFTKESAVFLAVVCLLYPGLAGGQRKAVSRNKFFWFGWIFAVGSFIFIRKIALPNPVEPDVLYVVRQFLSDLPVFIQYIGKLILPLGLSVWPVMKDTSFLYGAVSVVLILAAVIFSKAPRYGLMIFGALWFALFLSPSLICLASARNAAFFEHRLYLPILGVMIVLAETDIFKKFDPKKKSCFIPAALCVIVFSVMAIRHSESFRDRFAFWQSAVKSSPSSVVTHTNLGYVYLLDRSFDNAIGEFKKTIKIAPDRAFGYNYLGSCYAEKGMFPEARIELEKALALDPASGDIRNNLINVYFREGKLKEAERLIAR